MDCRFTSYFKGRNFRGKKLSRMDEFAKFLHFARINFRELSFLECFTGINFRESGFLWFAFFDLTYRHLAVLCFLSYASSIWRRQEDKTMLIPIMIFCSFTPKTWKISRIYCFSYFSREKTFANQPLQNFSRKLLSRICPKFAKIAKVSFRESFFL